MGAGKNAAILARENARLREQNEELDRTKAKLEERCGALQTELQEILGKNEILREKLDRLIRRHFGRSSEKMHPDQLGLFVDPEEPGSLPMRELAPDDESTVPTSPKARNRKPRAPRKPQFPEDLPTEEIIHDLPDPEKICDHCQRSLVEIGRETSDQYDLVPASFRRIRHVRLKYACKECEECVKRAPAPVRPLAKAVPGAVLLAYLVVSKYKDHLPLNRISRIFERLGASLSRQTLCDWVLGVAHLVAPVVARMREEILDSDYIQTDDTRILVQVPRKGNPKKTITVQGYLWPYRANDQVVYDFTQGRTRDGPEAFLEEFQGHLQTDDYNAYHRLQRRAEITGVGCWAHSRRRFKDAFHGDLERVGPLLACIQILYRMEREFKDVRLPAEQRLAERRKRSRPVLADLLWSVRQLQRDHVIPPKTLLGKALGYLLRNRKNLVEFTRDGKLEIDNNGVEQCVRPIACGRKNWLFAGSPRGAKAAAGLYSLIETCRLKGIEPFAYFQDILRRLPTATPDEVAMLTPGNWTPAQPPIEAPDVSAD